MFEIFPANQRQKIRETTAAKTNSNGSESPGESRYLALRAPALDKRGPKPLSSENSMEWCTTISQARHVTSPSRLMAPSFLRTFEAAQASNFQKSMLWRLRSLNLFYFLILQFQNRRKTVLVSEIPGSCLGLGSPLFGRTLRTETRFGTGSSPSRDNSDWTVGRCRLQFRAFWK